MSANNVLSEYKDGKSEEFLLESTIQHLFVFQWNTITLTLKALPRANKNKSEYLLYDNPMDCPKIFQVLPRHKYVIDDIHVIYAKLLAEAMIREQLSP